MLATTVAYLQQHPEIDLVCGAWDSIDESGQMITPANKPSNFQARVRADFLRALATGNLFLVHALLIRKKCFACCGNFDTSLKAVEDWDLWTRMAVHGHKADVIDVPVARYRRHKANMTREPQRMEQASQQVITRIFSDAQLADRIADLKDHAYIFAWLTIAGHCYEAGGEADAQKYVRLAEELYHDAPPNPELSLLYLEKLFLLPGAEPFMQTIATTVPTTKPLYTWFTVRQKLQHKHYGIAFLKISQLLASRPDWLFQKVIRRIGREIALGRS
jgi:hypothetical protein